MAEFKDIFYELRKSRSYTQEQIAKMLHVSNSTVAMWETGKRTPTRHKYEAVADIFNVDIDYLYGKTDIKRKTMYDEFGNEYYPAASSVSDFPAASPPLSDEAMTVARAYMQAEDYRQRAVCDILHIKKDASIPEQDGLYIA